MTYDGQNAALGSNTTLGADSVELFESLGCAVGYEKVLVSHGSEQGKRSISRHDIRFSQVMEARSRTLSSQH